MRKRRRVLGIAALALLLLGGAAWRYNQTRKVPLDRAINPFYWLDHWRGKDRYDPQTALLWHGNPAYREVALTIDDGPDPRYGPQIIALLHQRHIAATFFLVGIRTKQHPEIARLLARDGFEIGNHTYDHQRLPALKPHEIANELRLCDARIYAVTGHHTNLMRPPGEERNDKVLGVAKALGYVTVYWTCGAPDYNSAYSADWIAKRVLDRTEPGSIILLHQDMPSTLTALPIIIDGLQSQGYKFVTVSQMLAHLGIHRPRT
jgi:peptidoglycan/xylan/chitin deacetylase (PgdA/CDA1 family)